MCIAIPGRVVAIGDNQAEIDVLGVRRRAGAMLVPDLVVGDYVLVNAGMIVQVMDESEAEASISLFQELMELDLTDEDDS